MIPVLTCQLEIAVFCALPLIEDFLDLDDPSVQLESSGDLTGTRPKVAFNPHMHGSRFWNDSSIEMVFPDRLNEASLWPLVADIFGKSHFLVDFESVITVIGDSIAVEVDLPSVGC